MIVDGLNSALMQLYTLDRENKGLRDVNKRLAEMLRRVAMDYGEQCDDPWNCACSMAEAVRFARVGLK